MPDLKSLLKKLTGEAETSSTKYYRSELKKVFSKAKTQYAPTIKVFANGNGENTKHMDLNRESASALIDWLYSEFIAGERLDDKTLLDK